MTAQTPVSPRITLLYETLENGQQDVLDAFWREIEERGTPLVEEVDEKRVYI